MSDFRSALLNVLAHRASPPEYPGLALVPVPDLDALAAADSELVAAAQGVLDLYDSLERWPERDGKPWSPWPEIDRLRVALGDVR